MTELWRAIGELAAALHMDRVEALADSISNIDSSAEFARAYHAVGPYVESKGFTRFKTAWTAMPAVTPAEVAAALRGAAQAARKVSSDEVTELVWTGPETGLIPTRKTEQAILEVIDSAEERLFVVSYAFYGATSIVLALNQAIDRGVEVEILLESSKQHGGTVGSDAVKAMHAAVPQAEFYVWNYSETKSGDTSSSAVVHAKCAVADGRLAFITSANLTSAALERNMELGILIRGGTAPERLLAHFEALVTTKTINTWKP